MKPKDQKKQKKKHQVSQANGTVKKPENSEKVKQDKAKDSDREDSEEEIVQEENAIDEPTENQEDTAQEKPDTELRQRKNVGRKHKEDNEEEIKKKVPHANKSKTSLRRSWTFYGILAIIFVLSVWTRLKDVEKPDWICWDETHFGKHASFYINGEFFFDVHPPLGKMLLGLSGWLTGYDGKFAFDKPGDLYNEHNYVGMRMFCALLGSACIPLAYLIVWELTRSTAASVIAATFIIFDTGCLTISQYILLDPILMFYIITAAYCLTMFHSCRDRPFTAEWWAWMIATGTFLACSFSVKWVGLFVILWAGLSTVSDLWELLGDLSLSLVLLCKHFFARVAGLIVLPVTVYLFWFYIHFKALPNSGAGDGFFSSAFQATLVGNQLYKAEIPSDVAFGSVVTLRNTRAGGSLLHSHWHLYPKEAGAEQQQITGYSHKDPNNEWLIKKAYEDYDDKKPVEYLKHGDWIRLEHVPTKRNLHSHQDKAPLTKHHFQVTGYGDNGQGDANDFWRIDVTSGTSQEGRIKTVRSVFRLVHVNTGCALSGTNKQLPKWGYEQLEITCNPIAEHSDNLWNIELHTNEKVPKTNVDLYTPSFLEKVYESHIVMAQTNSGFKPKEGEVTSQPWQWPINYRGQVFSGAEYRVYLLGNPVIWWTVLACQLIFFVIFGYHAVKQQRGYVETPVETARKKKYVISAGWLLIAWALHYFPFFTMGRVLYFHHYFPAFLFSSMAAAIVLDYLCTGMASFLNNPKRRDIVYYSSITFIIVVSIISFYMFRGLSYGMSGPMSHQPNCTHAAYKWLDSWEI